MKYVYCWLVVFFTLQAGAFTYELEKNSLLSPSFSDRAELAAIFEGKGFHKITDQTLSKTGLPFDGVYTTADWSKALLLKAGLKAPTNLEGQIIEEPSLGMLILHFKFEGSPYVLAATNLSRHEFAKIVKPWLKNSSKSALLQSLLLPQAQAFDCAMASSKFDSFVNTKGFIESQETLKSIGKCATDALGGAVQSVDSTFDFFKKLATDPKALWGEMKDSFVELKSFVLNINEEMKSVYAAFGSMTPEQRTQIACTMTGELIAGALQAMVAGAGLAKLLPGLILKMKAATATLTKLAGLEKKGIALPDKSLLTREALSCAR